MKSRLAAVLSGFCLVSLLLLPLAAAQQAPKGASRLLLTPGELFTLKLDAEVDRLALGDPSIADVNVLSADEILIQARSIGVTNLIIWHVNKPQTEIVVNVVDPRPLNVSKDLSRILARDDKFKAVKVELEQDKVFLMGSVPDDETYASLMELVANYPDVIVNMVNVSTVEEFEIPKQMIQLKVRLVELTRTDDYNVGISWNETFGIAETQTAAFFTTASQGSPGDVFGRWYEGVGRDPLQTVISSLISEGKAKVLSEPLLVTTSGKEATTHIGVDVPIIKEIEDDNETRQRNITVDYREIGVVLSMTPTALTVAGKEQINVLLSTEVSSLDTSSGLAIENLVTLPAFKVRTTETEVTSAPGETFVIAGLLSSDDQILNSRVPFVSKIPVLGRLFQNPVKDVRRTELLITVTPDFVGDVNRTATAREVAFRQAVAKANEEKGSQDPVLEYARQVQILVADKLTFPADSVVDKSLTVRMRLQILRDGTLEQVVIAQPSGEDLFDYRAITAASSVELYPELPDTISGPDLWVEVPIVFQP